MRARGWSPRLMLGLGFIIDLMVVLTSFTPLNACAAQEPAADSTASTISTEVSSPASAPRSNWSPFYYGSAAIGNYQTTNVDWPGSRQMSAISGHLMAGRTVRPWLGLEIFWFSHGGSLSRPPGYPAGFVWDGSASVNSNVVGVAARLTRTGEAWDWFLRGGIGLESTSISVHTTTLDCIPPLICIPTGSTDTQSSDAGPAPTVSAGFAWFFRDISTASGIRGSVLDGQLGLGLDGGFLMERRHFSEFGGDVDFSGWYAQISVAMRLRSL